MTLSCGYIWFIPSCVLAAQCFRRQGLLWHFLLRFLIAAGWEVLMLQKWTNGTGGGTDEGVMGNKRIKEWKRKSRKLVGDHREGQDKEKGGKDEDRGRQGWGKDREGR